MTEATAVPATRRAARSEPPKTGLGSGDYVTNPLKPDWGPGRVVDVKRDVVFVFFRDRPGREVIRMKESGVVPTQADAELEALPAFVEKGNGYVLPRVTKKRAAAATAKVDIADSFVAFVDTKVTPLRDANPDWKRLDGATSGSNADVVGAFRYKGAAYRVHADTHFEPLYVAYQAVKAGEEEPFTEAPTKTGERLDLTPALKEQVKGRARHLYAYGAAKP